MAETIVSSPYGDVTVMHPDGASEDDIINYAKQNYGNPNTAADVTKSVLAAPRKMVEGIAGLPGSILNTMQSGVNAGMDYLTGTPLTDAQKQLIPHEPTASDIQAQTSKVLGPSYQSQTVPGEFAGAMTQGALGGLAGAGPKLAAAITGAMSGAGGEAASQMVPQNSFWQLPAQILGSLAGGISSIAGGKALQGVRNYSAGNTVGQQIGQQLGGSPISSGAVSRVASDVAADNITPQAAAQTANALGPEARLFDTGRQLKNTAALGLGTIPGPAQSDILSTIQGRTGQLLPTGEYQTGANSAVRLNKDFDQALGPVHNMVALKQGIMDQYGPQVKQAYESVMDAHPNIEVPPSITNRPSVANAMNNAENIAADHGETLRPTTQPVTELAGPGYHIANDVNSPPPTSLKYWDYVKKGMDQKITNMVKGGMDNLNGGQMSTLGGMLDAKNSLVSFLDQATGGAYKQARQYSATQKGMDEATEFGSNLFNNKVYPEIVKQQFDDLSIPEQAIAKASIRRELSNRMGSVGNDASKARQIFDQNNVNEKTAAIFGPQAAAQVKNAVDRENAFQGTTNMTANSLTQPRQQVAASIPGGAGPPTIPSMPTAYGAITAPLRMGFNAMHNMGSQNTQQGMARMLQSQGQDIPAVVKLLRGYNSRVAENQAAPVSTQAQAMIRALMAQGLGR